MNYLTEIREFYNWLECNPISTSAICLWHAFMNVSNKTGWLEWFTVPVATLELKTGLSRRDVYRARNILKQFGRIEFKERSGSQCAMYKVMPFVCQYDTQHVTQNDIQPVTQSDTQPVTQSALLNKPNKTKPNINAPPLSPSRRKPTEAADPFRHLPEGVRAVLEKWIAYKKERGFSYKGTGLSTLINRAVSMTEKHGLKAVSDAVEESISNGYQGIVWDRITNGQGSKKKNAANDYQQRSYSKEAWESIYVDLNGD